MVQYLNLSKNEKVYRLKTTKNVEVFSHFLLKKTELYVVKFLSILSYLELSYSYNKFKYKHHVQFER